jgi:hypothetical protein
MAQIDKDFDQPLAGFSNILLHKGVFTSNNGGTEVTMSIENYYLDTMLLLTKLRWKWTGWAVFCEILRRAGKKMRIMPYNTGIESLSAADTQAQAIAKLKKNFNATAGPTDWSKSAPKGQTVLSCGGSTQNQQIGTLIGDGTGSDVVVNFSPAMWVKSDVTAAFGATNATGPGVSKEEILLHEIVHGMRQMSGTARCAAVPDNPGMDTVEEFMAIVISNVYHSEQNLPGLRSDHKGFIPLSADLSDTNKFVNFNKDLPTSNLKRLQQLKSEHPQLCENLKKVQATFNPFQVV